MSGTPELAPRMAAGGPQQFDHFASPSVSEENNIFGRNDDIICKRSVTVNATYDCILANVFLADFALITCSVGDVHLGSCVKFFAEKFQ